MKYVKTLWKGWKQIALAIGTFQSRVILTIFYFVFLLPFGIVISKKIKIAPNGWITKETHQNSLEALKQQ